MTQQKQKNTQKFALNEGFFLKTQRKEKNQQIITKLSKYLTEKLHK